MVTKAFKAQTVSETVSPGSIKPSPSFSSIFSFSRSQPTMNVPSANLTLNHSIPMNIGSRKPLIAFIQKKILVLDLDETLVHATTVPSQIHDFSLRISIAGEPCTFYVFKRPHVEFFIETVSHLIF